MTARGPGGEAQHAYDALVLSPGAFAVRPPLPGVDLPGIFAMKTIPDTRLVKQWIAQTGAKSAAVVGGGFIGLVRRRPGRQQGGRAAGGWHCKSPHDRLACLQEMAENFVHLGLDTCVIEMLPQVGRQRPCARGARSPARGFGLPETPQPCRCALRFLAPALA